MLFQYEYHDTVIHRLNPLSKLLLFGSFLTLAGIYLDPRTKIPMLILLFAILKLARLSVKPYVGILVIVSLGVMVGQSYTAVLMLDPNYFKTYPHEWVSTVILQLTPAGFPVFGRAAITYGALLYLLSFPLQEIPVILSVAGLLYTTSLSEIVSSLSKLKVPFPVIFVTTVALRFIPEIVDNIRLTMRAQSLRGWTAETRNPFKRVALLRPLLVPLTRNVVRSVDILSMSSKNRAFGLGRVTATTTFAFKRSDYLVSAFAVVLMVLAIYATFAWNIGAL